MYALSVAHDRSAESASRWLREGEQRPESQRFYLAVGRHQQRGRAELVGEVFAQHERLQPEGAFTHISLRVSEQERAVAVVSPAGAELRIGLAARRLIESELPRMQGFAVVRMDRADAIHAHVVLSPVLRDGGTAPLLTRADVTRLDKAWDRELMRVFRPEREVRAAALEHRGLEPATGKEASELLGKYQEAQTEARAALVGRMRGELSQDDLRAAGEKVEAARQVWNRHVTQALERLAGPMPVATITVRVPGGAAYLARFSEEDRRDAIRSAVQEALEGRVQHQPLGVVHWPDGAGRSDLHVRILYEPHRLERENASLALEQRFVSELRDAAQRFDAAGRGVNGTIERVEVLQSKAPDRAELVADVGRGAAPATHTLAAELVQANAKDLAARPLARDLAGERLITVRMPLSPPLHERLMQLPDETRRAVLQDAVHAAYPALAKADVRDNFTHQPPGRDPAAVSIYVPVRTISSGGASSRTPEARFTHHLTMAVTSSRHEGLARVASQALHAPSQDGIARAALAGSALARSAPALASTALSRAVPALVVASRAVGRLMPGREE